MAACDAAVPRYFEVIHPLSDPSDTLLHEDFDWATTQTFELANLLALKFTWTKLFLRFCRFSRQERDDKVATQVLSVAARRVAQAFLLSTARGAPAPPARRVPAAHRSRPGAFPGAAPAPTAPARAERCPPLQQGGNR